MPPSGQWPPSPPPSPGKPQGMPPGPPNWGPPQPWGPLSPQNGGNRSKWILGGLALLVVVVVTVVATLLFTRGEFGLKSRLRLPRHRAHPLIRRISPVLTTGIQSGSSLRTRHAQRGTPIAADVSSTQQEWLGSARSVDSSIRLDARPDESVRSGRRDAMRMQQTRLLSLQRDTPHRVMRELYEQFIAYWRAYADKVPNYIRSDDQLVSSCE